MKSKLLFVVNHFGYSNGVAISLRNMIESLDHEKYDISLLPLYKYDEEFAEPIKDKVHVIKGFGFYFRGFGRLVHLLPMRILYKVLVKDCYDVEISYQYGTPTRLLAESSNQRKICWMHTYDEGLVLRKYYEQYAKMVTVARVGADKLVKEGFDPNRVEYCYNIIDEERVRSLSKESIAESKKKTIIITVARLDPDKAFMRYFRCINSLKNLAEKENVEFWIIGGGSEEDALRKYVSDNNLDFCIKMFGAQKNPYKYMSRSDLYCCVSYREGFSTSCQEAAMLGIPVVSVNVDGAAELIELAGCGQVIDNSEKGICEGISDIISNADKLAVWKRKADENRIFFYKAERIIKMEKVIDEVAALE